MTQFGTILHFFGPECHGKHVSCRRQAGWQRNTHTTDHPLPRVCAPQPIPIGCVLTSAGGVTPPISDIMVTGTAGFRPAEPIGLGWGLNPGYVFNKNNGYTINTYTSPCPQPFSFSFSFLLPAPFPTPLQLHRGTDLRPPQQPPPLGHPAQSEPEGADKK